MPKEKISKLMHSIASVLSNQLIPARLLASVTGQIISMNLAIGPVARLCTRALYEVINTRKFWSEKLTLSPLALCFGSLPCRPLMAVQFGSLLVLQE